MKRKQSDFLKEKFAMLQKAIKIQFDLNKQAFVHRGNRGAGAEIILKDFLRSYLPPKYSIGNGEVIDSHGNSSGQVDIILVNEHHPYVNNFDQPSIYFCEGVGCAGEVKSLLNGEELQKAIIGCKKLKSCIREFEAGVEVVGNISDMNRFTSRVPYFLFCFSSNLSLRTIHDRLQEYKSLTDGEDAIDAVIILDKGVVLDFGDGLGSFQFIFSADNAPAMGYLPVASQEEGEVLMDMVRFLHACLVDVPQPRPILRRYMI